MTINLSIYVESGDAKEMFDAIQEIVDSYGGDIKGLEIKQGLFDE